jgi:calpain-15
MASSKEIHPGITLHRKVIGYEEQELSIENKLMNILEFTVNFEGSTNISLKNNATLTTTITVNPNQTELLATVLTQGSWEMKQTFRFLLKPPPKEIADKLIAENKSLIQPKIEESRKLISTCSIDRLSQRRVASTTGNFTDPYFPPYHSSIFRGAQDARLNSAVVWRRPHEFFKGPFELFDIIEPNDIKQGMLGDCWLMCALSSLAEREELVRRLFITKEANEQGIYRVRICKDGEWITVTIDDYFPCSPQGLPIFSRSHGNELWVLLLEKAFAKVNGSYMLLRGGWAYEGMSDLTGCPTENFDFEEEEAQTMIRRGEMWNMLEQADSEGSLISASTPGEDRWTETGGPNKKGGLVPGHAYTVISVKEAHGFKLINIRNPWGNFEWEGDWSDNSPLWTQQMKDALTPVLDSNDGTFLDEL